VLVVDKRLGRGLDFLLSDKDRPAAAGEPGVTQIEVNQLAPSPYQPRREFSEEELGELAESIRSSGVLQPILVRRVGEQFEIIAGERRWRAAKRVGLERIPALVRDVNDQLAAVFGLVENLQRADLNAIEKAKAFARIQMLTGGTQGDVARQVGLNRSTVANFQRLLELPEEVQQHVSRGTLTMGHARALLSLADPSEQLQVAEDVIRRGLSVRQVEALVQDLADGKGTAPAPSGSSGSTKSGGEHRREPWLIEIEDTLAETLGTKVDVRYSAKRSRITIECLGREEFERVYDLLRGGGEE
jgi:ParB family chromosome partitioning protein